MSENSRASNYAKINTTDSKNNIQNHSKIRSIQEHFSQKIDEYLRTASFKPILLVLIKKEWSY